MAFDLKLPHYHPKCELEMCEKTIFDIYILIINISSKIYNNLRSLSMIHYKLLKYCPILPFHH